MKGTSKGNDQIKEQAEEVSSGGQRRFRSKSVGSSLSEERTHVNVGSFLEGQSVVEPEGLEIQDLRSQKRTLSFKPPGLCENLLALLRYAMIMV